MRNKYKFTSWCLLETPTTSAFKSVLFQVVLPQVTITEWTWRKAPISCPWVKESKNTYDFNVKKADKIFDLLLEKKQLRLPTNHVIPSAEELKGKKYCKFHNSTNHNTSKCRIVRLHIQKAIEQKERSSLSQSRNQQWTQISILS